MLESHLRLIARHIRDGTIVPFLGAGVNLCGRSGTDHFEAGRSLPSGAELAKYLADYSEYVHDDDNDLVRVSQYVAVIDGMGPLRKKLHEVFNHDYPPTDLHRLLAELPQILRRQGMPRYQLIVTTNYDDALERSFESLEEPVDVLTYLAGGSDRGKFLHRDPSGDVRPIRTPNKYDRLSLDERTVILKIHGAIDRNDAERDSYVITEDHYIDYLTRTEIAKLIPVKLAAKMMKSHFLFLGYSLRDWNLRVILHRIWDLQNGQYNSWAVQLDPELIDTKAWAERSVDIIPARLEDFIVGLRSVLATGVAESPL